ncbi:MAG: hypothetical protein WC775_00560 [Patescibacteria group bacterium]|jgi:hypothetical protein
MVLEKEDGADRLGVSPIDQLISMAERLGVGETMEMRTVRVEALAALDLVTLKTLIVRYHELGELIVNAKPDNPKAQIGLSLLITAIYFSKGMRADYKAGIEDALLYAEHIGETELVESLTKLMHPARP